MDAAQRHHYLVIKGIEISLEKRQLDRDKIASLFGYFKSQELLTELQASTGSVAQRRLALQIDTSVPRFEAVLKEVPQLDSELPYASKYIGVFLGRAVLDGMRSRSQGSLEANHPRQVFCP